MTGMVAGQIPVAASATSVTGSIASGQLPATTTNDSAAAGKVGEVISSVITTGVALPTATAVAVASIALTAGDWDVMGEVWFQPGTGTVSLFQAAINTAASIPGAPSIGSALWFVIPAAGGYTMVPLSPCRASLAGSATYFLVAEQTGGATYAAIGKIWARRAR
jgi:hypothetical protein